MPSLCAVQHNKNRIAHEKQPDCGSWARGEALPAGGNGGYSRCARWAQRNSRVFVIFTDYSGTLAALQMADRLTKRLEACLRLLRPYEVPYAVPLTAPSVSAEFLEEQLRAWASKFAMHTVAHIYLCRDKCRTLRLILKPGSIVILGGRRWWWTAEQKLARALKNDGHPVIFAESR